MTTDELEANLNRLGARLETWPVALADGARELIARSEEAASLVREARTLDEYLARSPGAVDHSALEQRILHSLADRDPLQAVLDWLAISFWRPAFIATLPLLFGFALGFVSQEPDPDGFLEDLATLTFYDAESFTEYDDE
jgi:hypothetical protein